MYYFPTQYIWSLKGQCPQICVLQRNRILVRKVKGGPNVFDIDQFVFYFAEELDYSMDNPSPAEKILMDKARLGFEDCKKKNPEYETMKNLSSNDCERWDKFFKCIENAIYCMGMRGVATIQQLGFDNQDAVS